MNGNKQLKEDSCGVCFNNLFYYVMSLLLVLYPHTTISNRFTSRGHIVNTRSYQPSLLNTVRYLIFYLKEDRDGSLAKCGKIVSTFYQTSNKFLHLSNVAKKLEFL